MKTSVIIPYRNRLDHLKVLIPALRDHLPTAEVIVVEQNDTGKFRKPCLLNIGAKHATGDTLIFHDVDYVPTTDVVYHSGTFDVYLPVKKARFIYNDGRNKPLEEVPGGYRHFINGVDDDFFGGVLVFTRQAFEKVNGSCTLYIGWGFEDADLRNRCLIHRLNIVRHPSNRFFVLDHPDSGPSFQDQDFLDNIHRAQRTQDFLKFGLNTTKATVSLETPLVTGVDKWIKASEFDGPTHIQVSTFNWEEGDE